MNDRGLNPIITQSSLNPFHPNIFIGGLAIISSFRVSLETNLITTRFFTRLHDDKKNLLILDGTISNSFTDRSEMLTTEFLCTDSICTDIATLLATRQPTSSY